MEQLLPPVPASIAPPHIVSITPVSALSPIKSEEPMVSTPSQSPPSEIKKELSSPVAKQSIQVVASQVKFRLPPTVLSF